MNILSLHAVGDPATTRRTSLNHLFFLPKYAPDHQYTFHKFGDPVSRVATTRFDAVILDTSFLCNRWLRPHKLFDQLRTTYDFVRHMDAVKIALPQDEYDHCELLDEWLTDWGVDVVYSPCFKDQALFYGRVSKRAEIVEALTGYVDDIDLELGRRHAKPFDEREIDVGYRARDLGALFGRLGRIKGALADAFVDAAAGSELRLDVSTRPEDTIIGEAWLRFMGNCRFSLGSNSGSSLLDRRGRIRDAIAAYTAVYPDADFDAVEAACFPGLDGRHEMTALSPRIFETVVGGSCPVLVKGWYSGALEPDVHYIPIEPDFSNLKDVVERLHATDAARRMAERCYTDLILDDRFRYSTLARSVVGMIEKRRPDSISVGHVDASRVPQSVAEREEMAMLRLRLAVARAEARNQIRSIAGGLYFEAQRIGRFCQRTIGKRGFMSQFFKASRLLLQIWWKRR